MKQVYVRDEPESKLTAVHEEIWKRVNSDMKKQHNTKVKIANDCEKWRDKSVNTVVFCSVSSRLASNAKHAMKDIQGHKKMALVFLHHVAPHVPFDTDSESVLLADEFRSLGAMIDVVFFGDQGMYHCPANTRAIEKFCKFLTCKSISVSNQDNRRDDIPSYQSIYSDMKRTNQEYKGVLHNVCKRCCAAMYESVYVLLALFLLAAIHIPMILFGWLYLYDCPLESYIPRYLIMAGSVGVTSFLCYMGIRFKKLRSEESTGDRKWGCYAAFGCFVGFFLLALLITESVLVYSTYDEWSPDETDPNYCHPTLYNFAFWLITSSYIVMALIFFSICCVIVVSCCDSDD